VEGELLTLDPREEFAECQRLLNRERPIPAKTAWRQLIEVWRKLVGKAKQKKAEK
jgi:hypothetical protein